MLDNIGHNSTPPQRPPPPPPLKKKAPTVTLGPFIPSPAF